jgi:GWxTD domain-containing protein
MNGTRALILLLAGLTACVIPSDFYNKDLKALYDPAIRFTRVTGQAIHLNDSSIEVTLSLNMADFSYQQKAGRPARANILITYSLTDGYENLNMIREDSLLLTDTVSQPDGKILEPVIRLKTAGNGELLFSATVFDRNSGRNIEYFLVIRKQNHNSRENFFMVSSGNYRIPGDHAYPGQQLRIKSFTNTSPVLYGRYYGTTFPVAAPPYSMEKGDAFSYKADSTFRLDFQSGSTPLFSPVRKGLYHFQSDTTGKEGFSIFVTDPDFPILSQPEHILEPLSYITTSKEYTRMSAYTDIKLAVDSFWIVRAGNTERAKSMVYKYYNRVQEANVLFTSYLEGWKSDRGMIYIIFGPPNHVYRATNVENWTYGDINAPQSLRFSFVKVNNPFTDNDFSLTRNPNYKESWFNSVEIWRR